MFNTKYNASRSGPASTASIAPAAIAIASITVALAYWPTTESQQASRHTASELVQILGNRPRASNSTPLQVQLSLKQDELDHYITCISTPTADVRGQVSRSRRLHAGLLAKMIDKWPTWINDPNTQSIDYRTIQLGQSEFVQTWRGLEPAMSQRGKRYEHRDQTLATLAQMGIHLDDMVEVGNKKEPVSALLETTISEFHLDQRELSWTASALISYLPPQKRWWNRFGEEYTFDDLADNILERNLADASCRGLHLVMVMTQLINADKRSRIVSDQTRKRVELRLVKMLDDAVASQQTDGSWPASWAPSSLPGNRAYTPTSSELVRLTVTGHMIEWFHLLPSDMKPPRQAAERGLRWLLETLRNSDAASLNTKFCPYTHAVLSLIAAREATNGKHGI